MIPLAPRGNCVGAQVQDSRHDTTLASPHSPTSFRQGRALITPSGTPDEHPENAEAPTAPADSGQPGMAVTPPGIASWSPGAKGLHKGSRSGLVADRRQGAAGRQADRAACPGLARGNRHYQGLVGERVRVVDPLGGAVHVTRLAGAPQRWNDLVIVLAAEQLGLTRVQSNP